MLVVNQVYYSYDNKEDTLKNISMNFDKGNIIGILGANGSGKSTLMKLIMGLYKPKSGDILYQDETIKYDKKSLYAYRQEVGIVFQDSEQQLFYALVEDDVALALRNLKYDESVVLERVNQALKDMHITHLRKKPIQYLSFGQKKRVAIAGVLALQPKYLLLDEPTAGLDPRGRLQMLRLMKMLAKKGTTIILTSHDMDLMYDCCDYAYVINQGEIVDEGEKSKVFFNSKLLHDVGLSTPWLVRLHQQLQLPLYNSEEEFFEKVGLENGKINNGSRNCIRRG